MFTWYLLCECDHADNRQHINSTQNRLVLHLMWNLEQKNILTLGDADGVVGKRNSIKYSTFCVNIRILLMICHSLRIRGFLKK